MRRKLAKINGSRQRFRGTFVRYGTKPAWNSPVPLPTILLKDVQDAATGSVVTDHLWFNLTKGFAALDLAPGDLVEFDARVKPYQKGRVNRWQGIDERTTDYKLSHPTKIQKVA